MRMDLSNQLYKYKISLRISTQIGLALVLIIIVLGSVQAITITVGPKESDYKSIQAAIDAASPDDIILVSNGTYYECLVLSKPVILRGIDKPRIDMGFFFSKSGGTMEYENMGACDLRSGVGISVDGITLDGFEIANYPEDAVHLKAKNCIIKNCDFRLDAGFGYTMGIYVDSGSNGNTISNNYGDKIYLHEGSYNNSVVNNTVSDITLSYQSDSNVISDNKVDGRISLWGDKNNVIENNTIRNIEIGKSINNIIRGNNLTGDGSFRDRTIFLRVDCNNNIITSNSGDALVYVTERSHHNTIENNKLRLVSISSGSSFNTIIGNEIIDPERSISISAGSSDNIVKDNIIHGEIYDEMQEHDYPAKNQIINNTNTAGVGLAESLYTLENLTAVSSVVINKILWSDRKLELYNPGNESVNIGGWMIWEDEPAAMGEMIPIGTILAGKERLVIDFPHLHDRGAIKLENTYGIKRDHITYENALKHIGEVYSRVPDGSNNWEWMKA